MPLDEDLRALRRAGLGAALGLGDRLLAAVRGDTERPALPPGDASPGEPTEPVRPTEPARPPVTAGHLLLGALVEVEARGTDAARTARRTVVRVGATVGWLAEAPVLAPARRGLTDRLERLAARGRDEEARSRAEAARVGGALVEDAVGSVLDSDRTLAIVGEVLDTVLPALLPTILDEVLPPVLGQIERDPGQLSGLVGAVVDEVLNPILVKVLGDLAADPAQLSPLVSAVVGEVLGPILDEAMPQVLDQLAADPEMLLPLVESMVGEIIDPVLRLALPKAIDYLNEDPEVIQELVASQSVGVASEVAGTMRVRAARADGVVDRVMAAVLRRRGEPMRTLTLPESEAEPAPPTPIPPSTAARPAPPAEVPAGEPAPPGSAT